MLTPRRLLVIGMILSAVGLMCAPPASAATLPSGSGRQLLSDFTHAWKITKGRGVTVAVLGDGVDPHVAGLVGKVTVGPNYVKLPHPDLLDGTLIAVGIVGQYPRMGSLADTLGLAPDARILSVRVVPGPTEPGAQKFYDQVFSGDIVARGIRYAVDHGAQVIVLSWLATSRDSASLEAAVQYAVARGVVLTTMATQVDPTASDPNYPAAIPGVIAAGLVTLPAPFQPPGSPFNGMATNESVLVAVPGNTQNEPGPADKIFLPDTVYAGSAWIAGTAALIKSAYPHLAPALVARAIATSARDHPRGGYNIKIGFGLINPYGALLAAGKLARLSATASPAQVSSAAHFGSPPVAAEARHRSTAKIALFAGIIAMGIMVLLVALVLAARRHRSAPVTADPPTPRPRRHSAPF